MILKPNRMQQPFPGQKDENWDGLVMYWKKIVEKEKKETRLIHKKRVTQQFADVFSRSHPIINFLCGV